MRKLSRPLHLKELPLENDYKKALDSITRYLAMRDHSLYELKSKLLRRFDRELVENLLQEAKEYGWLGDEKQIAERLVLALERRGKSPRYIEAQLKKKHLPLPPMRSDNEVEIIERLIQKKFGVLGLTFADKAKAYRYLKYRGFSDRAIRQVLK